MTASGAAAALDDQRQHGERPDQSFIRQRVWMAAPLSHAVGLVVRLV
jgi:hypothetical protein